MTSRSFNAFGIKHKNIKYSLKKPLRLTVTNTGTYYYIEYPELGIVGIGRTTKEAKNSFAYEFDHIYTSFNTNCNNEVITSDIIKSKLLNMVVAKKEIQNH